MTGLLSSIGRLFGRADAGISVPAMDGVFKPNNRPEQADRVAALAGVDDLAAMDDTLLASSGSRLFGIAADAGTCRELCAFLGDIGFVAPLTDGRMAVGVTGAGVHVGSPGDWKAIELAPDLAACMTAAAPLADGRLAICVGSRRNPASEWKRDLMEKGRSGCVCALDLETGTVELLAGELAYPYGVAVLHDGDIAVAESWRHRVVAIAGKGTRARVLLGDLPAYPARLAPAADGGFWLALFAPRRQLFEFVLREESYRKDMVAHIDPAEWVGPALAASTRHDHPLQQGAVRQMGILKPWAPSSSYGLVARCDGNMHPLASWHSRADGTMHGITGICETAAGVFAASRGAGTILRLSAGTEKTER